MTDHCDSLHAYVDGELGEAETTAFEAHLATCERCVAELPRLLALLDSLDGAADLARVKPPQLTVVDGGAPSDVGHVCTAAAVSGVTAGGAPRVAPAPSAPADELAARRGRRRTPRPTVWIAGLGAAAAAAVVILLLRPHAPKPTEVASLDGALGANRPFAGRLAYPGAGEYRPQDAERAGGTLATAPDRLLELELELETAKNWHGLGVVAMWAGDRERARQAFARAPATPEVDADRAALELLDGRPAALERGLEDVDRALAAAPGNAAARWNRALVLGAMNLSLAAAAEFDAIHAAGEPGWSAEARTRADALRAQVTRRNKHWKAAHEAGRKLIDDGTPVPGDVTDDTGIMTISLFDAARAAPSRERALALRPLAKTLDEVYRGTRLTEYVERVAASDFRVRRPLAERYRELALGRSTREATAALLAQLARSGPDDIRMGAMVFAGVVRAELDEYRKLAAATREPWFALIAEQEAAAAELARGERGAAERRLRDAIALASREHMAYRALRLQSDLVKLYKTTLQLGLAADQARTAYRDAIVAGEWVFEMGALADLAAIHHNRNAHGLARAYVTELAQRAETGVAAGADPRVNCQQRLYAYEVLANISLLQLDPDRARAEIAQAPRCDASSVTEEYAVLILRKAIIREKLYGFGHRAEDARLAREALAEVRALPASVAPGKDAFTAYVEGDFVIKDDPAAGERALREAIALAGNDTRDEFKIKARIYSFTVLALEAGRTSAFDRAIALVAESLGVHAPARCAVAIATDAARSVVAVRDASGAIDGQYVGERRRGPLDIPALVPQRSLERLRGCDKVAVLARAPVLGSGRLLPPDMAWSYLVSEPAAAARAPGARRLVVANPDAPAELDLPALAPYPDEPASSGAVVLRGADATPERTLSAMRDASVIEFHTHGIIADDLFEASQLVLSPGFDHRYALTSADVARVKLEASPLVILGACRAATSSRVPEGSMGLAEAFLHAGARAVIASPDAVQDRAALPLFAAIRERVLAGADPAVALRDERMRQPASMHDETWVSGVVVFE